MRFYCISDNTDTLVGMRLTGIKGVVVHTAEEVQAELEKAIADNDIGIVLMTNKLIKLCPDLIYDLKLNQKRPLIVEIPDRHGTTDVSNSITNYIREAIGIKI